MTFRFKVNKYLLTIVMKEDTKFKNNILKIIPTIILCGFQHTL
jgi:hypothetical protein